MEEVNWKVSTAGYESMAAHTTSRVRRGEAMLRYDGIFPTEGE
jgi:hypothetical protein